MHFLLRTELSGFILSPLVLRVSPVSIAGVRNEILRGVSDRDVSCVCCTTGSVLRSLWCGGRSEQLCVSPAL